MDKANSLCERFGGSLRRECLDFLILFHARHLKLILKSRATHHERHLKLILKSRATHHERHLKLILKSRATHFNHGRPQMSLGPGIPAPLQQPPPANVSRPPGSLFGARRFSAVSIKNTPWKRQRRELRKEHAGEARAATRCELLPGPPAGPDNVLADYRGSHCMNSHAVFLG
jgi:hypothetical protein